MGMTKIRLTEDKLRNMIREAVENMLNELNTYNATMQKANQQFGNNFMGRVRRMTMPKKYRQYQNIQKNAQQMGQTAADNFNKEREKVPVYNSSKYDVYGPDFFNYAKEQGLIDNEKPMPKWEEYGVEHPIYATSDEYKEYNRRMNNWWRMRDDQTQQGEDLYDKRTAPYQAAIKKYGTGGRQLKPMSGHDREYERNLEAYKSQQQRLNQNN